MNPLEGALILDCKCGRPGPTHQYATVYDPIDKKWRFLQWEPKPGILVKMGRPQFSEQVVIMGTDNADTCPVCGTTASRKNSLDDTHLPGECRDHLLSLHAPKPETPKITIKIGSKGLPPVRESDMGKGGILVDFPQPEER